MRNMLFKNTNNTIRIKIIVNIRIKMNLLKSCRKWANEEGLNTKKKNGRLVLKPLMNEKERLGSG